MALTLSKASSVNSSGLSPPAALTLTLLCKISIRAQRRIASSIAAASVTSRDVGFEWHAPEPLGCYLGDSFSRGIEAAIDVEDAPLRGDRTIGAIRSQ